MSSCIKIARLTLAYYRVARMVQRSKTISFDLIDLIRLHIDKYIERSPFASSRLFKNNLIIVNAFFFDFYTRLVYIVLFDVILPYFITYSYACTPNIDSHNFTH